MDYLIAIIGGGVGAALVSVVGALLLARQTRRYTLDDRTAAQAGKEQEDIQALKDGMSWLLYDRVLYLARKHLERGAISLDDLKIIEEQHRVYHDKLGGNGYLGKVMEAVEALPIVSKEGDL